MTRRRRRRARDDSLSPTLLGDSRMHVAFRISLSRAVRAIAALFAIALLVVEAPARATPTESARSTMESTLPTTLPKPPTTVAPLPAKEAQLPVAVELRVVERLDGLGAFGGSVPTSLLASRVRFDLAPFT